MNSASAIVFLLGILGVSAAAHAYVWLRLVRDPHWSRPVRRAATVVVAGLAVVAPLGLVLWRVAGRELAGPFAWVGGIAGGALLLVLTALGALDVLRVGHAATRRMRGASGPSDPSRRRFLARAGAGVAGATTAAATGLALTEAARPPRVERVDVVLPRLPRAFDGTTIAVLSDVHVGPVLGRAFVEDVVARTNALAPDLVAIPGDLVDGSVEELEAHVAPLAGLVARHGVWFTTGNHEYYSGVDPWLVHLRRLGIRTLRNERVELRRDGAAIDLAGIDDASARRFGGGHGADLDRALAGREPGRVVVLLAHQPRQVKEARRLDVDLQLSGHTHGGQIAPFGLLVRLVQPLVAGLGRFGPTTLYVSRGTGTWGPPMRLAAPGEISLVTLRRA